MLMMHVISRKILEISQLQVTFNQLLEMEMECSINSSGRY
jgi:hypothetical protein